MGIDAEWGRFPICPEMSRFVPVLSPFVLFCPGLSPFRASRRTNEDKRGQNGMCRDKLANAPFSTPQQAFGRRSWETLPADT